MNTSNKPNIIHENVLSILGLTHASEVELLRLTQKISELVQKRLMTRIVDHLSPEDMEIMVDYLEEGQDTQLGDFISEKIPQFYDMMNEEMVRVSEDMKGIMSEINEKIKPLT